jgi:site-specific recombinase XerD
MRLAELAGLKLKDINFDSGMIKIFGKGAKERAVHVSKPVINALMVYLQMRSDKCPELWVSEERKPLKRDGVRTMVKRLCKEAEVTVKPGAHTFRHTAAIMCLRNGMDSFTLQLMLGHSTPQMTQHYVSTLGSEDVAREHETASPVSRLGIK